MAKKFTQVEAEAYFLENKLRPLVPYINSITPWKSKCIECKNTIFPRMDHVRLRGHQCGYCAGRKGADVTALALLKTIGHIPLEPYRSALKPWKMKCGGCGKVIFPKYNSLQQGGWGCSFCGYSRAGAKKRKLGETKAIAQMREAFCEPLEPYPGNNFPWKSRCLKCDSLIQPRLAGIQSGQGGCRKCGVISSAKTRMFTEAQATKLALKKKLKPLEPYPGTAKKWKCECLRCGNIVSPRLNFIQRSVFGCPWCAKTIVDPQEARKKMLAAKLKPLVSYPGSGKKPWLCQCMECNREVSPAYASIRTGQGGCIWCAGKKVDPDYAVHQMLAKGVQPLEPFKSASTKWKCRCLKCFKESSPTFKEVSNNSTGCMYCATNYVDIEEIMKVMKSAGFIPKKKYVNSRSNWKVIHEECGRLIEITYGAVRAGHGCKRCKEKYVDSKDAVKIMLASGMKPLIKYPGAKRPWKSKCLVCLRIISPQFSSVSCRGSSCIYCSGRKVDVKEAMAIMKKSGLHPLEPFKSSLTKWKCLCLTCKRIVTPQYSSVKGGQGGCRFCADWGIDYAAPGFIYLMSHPELMAHKIGIGGLKQTRYRDRIKQHEKSGWALHMSRDFATADDAFQVEQIILRWLRLDKRLGVYLSEFEMPQGGYSETVDASEIDLPTIWAKVEELSRVKR